MGGGLLVSESCHNAALQTGRLQTSSLPHGPGDQKSEVQVQAAARGALTALGEGPALPLARF